MFERLIWKSDRMLLGDLVFRLEHFKDDSWDLGDECFAFIKIKPLIDQFARFWSWRPDFRPRNVFELGIWDGGSVAFWFEYFQPEKHVAIDLGKERLYPQAQVEDSAYFKRYVTSRNLEGRIKTYWGVDQGDARTLRDIVAREFSGPLDLVVDDASHLYRLTQASFETLFPLLRPGGLYLIEDWAWGHWKEFQSPDHPWAAETELTRLITELVEATGSSSALIASLSVLQGFAVVERGELDARELGSFRLEDHISRRPQRTKGWAPGPGKKSLFHLVRRFWRRMSRPATSSRGPENRAESGVP